MAQLVNFLDAKASEMGCSFGIAFKNISTGESFSYNEKEVMHAASLMKVPVMIEVYKQASQGKFALGDSLLVKNEFRSIVDGSSFSLDVADDGDDAIYARVGGRMTIYELTFEMITVSSNLATNILIDLVGADNVTASMRTLGAATIQVLRGVEDNKAFERGMNNTTDAYDMMVILESMARAELVSAAACQEMMEILLSQKFTTKIPALLPETIKVAHKTGSITRIDHDAGIVIFPSGERCVLVVLSKGIDDHVKAARAIAEITVATLTAHNLL